MEDERIITLYFNRDESAVTETARKYGALLRRISYQIVNSHADSEECENDTYRIAWDKIPPARPQSLSAFLGRIVRNVSLDRYRYNKAAKRNTEFDLALTELADCAPTSVSAETEAERRLLTEAIDRFLRALSPVKRMVFLRRYWYCDSIGQIARTFGFSESKVKSMLARIRESLKTDLERKELLL